MKALDLFNIETRVPVVFLYDCEAKGKEVIAFFPDEEFTPCLKKVYAPKEGFSGCHPNWVRACKRAVEEDYLYVKFQLEKYGYNLDIVNEKI